MQDLNVEFLYHEIQTYIFLVYSLLTYLEHLLLNALLKLFIQKEELFGKYLFYMF